MIRFGKQTSVRASVRWKQSVSNYMAEQIAERTLRTYRVAPAPVETPSQELARRLYNRNW